MAETAPAAVAVPVVRQREIVATRAEWPAGVGVDVLVQAPAPALEPTAVDDALRPVAATLRALPGATRVYLRARAGEARLLVRFAADADPAVAQAAVRQAWFAAPPAGFAEPQVAAIAPGARARVAMAVLAPGGRSQATAVLDRWLPQVLPAWPGATRLHAIGAVRDYLAVDLLPPTLATNAVDLGQVEQALRTLLRAPAPLTGTVAQAAQALQTAAAAVLLPRRTAPGAQPLPDVPLVSLLAVRQASGEPVREARNGQLPLTVLLGDGAAGPVEGPLAAAASAWRRAPTRLQELGPGVELHDLGVATAYRYVLHTPPDRQAEPLEALTARLQAVREIPDLTGMLAMQGLDGVPEALDVDAAGGRLWTVWVMVSAPDVALVLRQVHDRLAEGEAWHVRPLPETWDTGLGWVLGTWTTLAALASAPDAARLGPTVSAVGGAARRLQAVTELRTGPQRGAPPPAFARLERTLARRPELSPTVLELGLHLQGDRRHVGDFGPWPVWLGLPGGTLAAEQHKLPLAYAADGSPVRLGDLVRLPDPTPVLEAVRVDGRPALWLAAEAAGELPMAFALPVWDAVERAAVLGGGLRIEPLLVGVPALGEGGGP